MYSINKYSDHIHHLREFGYVHIKSIINQNKINDFRNTFFSLFNFYSHNKIESNFDCEEFVHKLSDFRKKDPDALHGLFRTFKHTYAFNNLFNEQALYSLISSILNEDYLNLIIAEHQFRLDEPNDRLFTLEWHQDSTYYEQDRKGKNSLVINMCVQNNTSEMGVPRLIQGSHKLGKLENDKITKFNTNVEQNKVDATYIDKENIKIIEPEAGDIVIYDMNLIHQSGYNSTQKARFSVIGRAFNPKSKDYHHFYYPKKELIGK